MPGPGQRHGTTILEHPPFTVIAATAEHMLAMKAEPPAPPTAMTSSSCYLSASTPIWHKSTLS